MDNSDYTVRLLNLPAAVGGFVTESPDGHTNVYINARHGWRGQRRSLDHELTHVEHDDLHSTEPLAVIEAPADGVDLKPMTVPGLVRARDLMPPEPEPEPEPEPFKPTPRQISVVMTALSDLDRCFFNAEIDF